MKEEKCEDTTQDAKRENLTLRRGKNKKHFVVGLYSWLQSGKINNKIFKGRVLDGNDEP